MGETAEHDMAHGVDLRVRSLDKCWVAVAVGGSPPRTHSVNDAGAVVEGEVDPCSTGDRDGIHRSGCSAIGVPNVCLVIGDELGGEAVGITVRLEHRS